MAVIYGLKCTVNGKAYIGCTAAKLSKRLREHRCLLRSGKHSEKELLADWVLHGESSFQMICLEVLPPDAPVSEKRRQEIWWMNRFKADGLLYNKNLSSFAPKPEAQKIGVKLAALVEGRKRSPEANLKRSLAQLGKPKNHGHKISATKRAKQLMR